MHYEILIPTQIFIEKVTPILEGEGKVLAKRILGKLMEEFPIEMVEFIGIEPEIYENCKAECLLEITNAEFSPIIKNEEREDKQDGCIAVEYLGFCPTAHFFPKPDEEYLEQENKSSEDLYVSYLNKQFAEYGDAGFGLLPLENHPTLQLPDGCVLLLNKYIFEKELRSLEEGKTVGMKIKEAQLLSITAARKELPTIEEVREKKRQAKEMRQINPKRRKKWKIF